MYLWRLVVVFIGVANPPHHLLPPTPPCPHSQARNQQADMKKQEKDALRGQQFARWQAHSVSIRTAMGVTPEFYPWTSKPGVFLHGVPKVCARVVDLINCAYIDTLKKNAALPIDQQRPWSELRKGLMVDCSQAVQRKPWGCQIKTLTTSTMVYTFECDCLLTSRMLFRLHGYPKLVQLTQSEGLQRSLIGESWSLPCAGVALYS